MVRFLRTQAMKTNACAYYLLIFMMTCWVTGAGWASSPSLQPSAPSATDQTFGGNRFKNAETVITALERAAFNNKTGIAEFIGSVSVKDPQFDLTCDRLTAHLNAERRGLEKIVATGNVVIRQENRDENGRTVLSVARAGRVVFFPATGELELTEWPQISQGINAHTATEATTKMVLNRAGRITTIGGSRTTIIETSQAAQ